MNEQRIQRIAEEIKRVVSSLLINGIKDPRVGELTTVADVEVTGDLSYATIYYSVIGDDEKREEALKGLNSAKGFIRSEISKALSLRIVPELIFKIDDTVDRGMYMDELIEKVRQEDEKKKQ